MTFDQLKTIESQPVVPEGCDVLLAESYAQAKNWNRAHHGSATTPVPQGCFGIIAQTFPSWIEGVWELYGNGHRLISDLERLVIAERALTEQPLRHLVQTPNLSYALSICARQGLGAPAFDEAVRRAAAGRKPASSSAAASFSNAEWELLERTARYAELVKHAGLIEMGSALSYLAAHAQDAFPHPLTVCHMGAAPLPAAQERFFNEIDALHLQRIGASKAGKLTAIPRDRVRFAFPSGSYAQPIAVLQAIDEIVAAHPDATIAIAAKRPLDLYQRIAPALTERDLTVAVKAQRRFDETDFGIAYNNLVAVHLDVVPWNRAALTDVLHSTFLHLDKTTVWQWDRRLRNDRLIDRAAVLAALRGNARDGLPSLPPLSARAFAALDDAACLTAFDAACCKKQYQSLGDAQVSSAAIREQLLAIDLLGETLRQTARFGLTQAETLRNVLAHTSFSVSRSTAPTEAGRIPRVTIMSQQQASQLAPESVTGLIVCDLTSDDYPLTERHSSTERLLEHFDLPYQTETPLARARRQFAALTKVPNARLMLARQLSDAAANPLYPCAMWEEFVDAYRMRSETGEPEAVDDLYLLPDSLRDQRIDAGEDDVFADICPGRKEDVLAFLKDSEPERGNVGNLAAYIAHPFPEPTPDAELCRLSPSQIDDYLACPYRWFISRRLGAEGLDEDFGPAERGEFMHRVFQVFYRTFGEKVTEDNLARARALMFEGPDCLFDTVRREQAARAPMRRYAPLPGTIEEHEFDEIKALVDEWLTFETTFLPTFTPVAFEYDIGEVPFAGAMLSGRIDRIDMDAQGRAVIIDYKGSMTAEYRALETDPDDADRLQFRSHGKIQGLVYAAALKQLGALDLTDPPATRRIPIHDVVGALYVSYNKGNEVLGAYAMSAIGSAAAIPTLSHAADCSLDAVGSLSFEALQDHVADRVHQTVCAIEDGCVAPLPSYDDVCAFCPITMCEERRSR